MGVRWHLIREFFGPNQFDSGSFWSNIQGRMSDISHDVNDEFVPEDELEAPQAAIKKLREKLKKVEAEKQEYLDLSQRLRADYANLRRQSESEKAEFAKFAAANLLGELIELADTFELAFANKEAWQAAPENWRRGVEYIYSQLTTLFGRHGLETIDPAGQTFDPALHHSLGTIDTERDEEDNKVLAVVQKGYKLRDKILRPAQVKVGHKK